MSDQTMTRAPRRKYSKRYIQENVQLYAIMAPVLILIAVFSYVPMYGIVMAFQDYVPGTPFLSPSADWVGLKHFTKFISSIFFDRLLRNTVLLSLYSLVFGFWVPIAFALVLNEVKNITYRRIVQTASYMPYFISMVVVAGMVMTFVGTNGIVNNIIVAFGGERSSLYTNPAAFPVVYTITGIWKSFGWNSILYLSAMSSIDPALHEAAMIDGATRPKRIWYITMPHIMPMVAMLLILAVGGMISSNMELILLLYNSAVYETADVFSTYTYRVGLVGGKFSSGTAVSLMTTVVNFVLLFAANKISNKMVGHGLW